VTTRSDPDGRPVVIDLLPPAAAAVVYPVGRLDFDAEGLLLLTNDGELTQRLTHPSFGVVKTYLAEVEGDPAPAAVRQLREGVALDDGLTAPARVTVVQRRGDTSAVELGIHEGRNRQVRRMCDAIGHPVRRLVRTRIGPLRDGSLAPGTWRALTPAEVRRLYEAASEGSNPPDVDEARG
jgi:23S rRNA pseudouridine2605 synthase